MDHDSPPPSFDLAAGSIWILGDHAKEIEVTDFKSEVGFDL